MTGLRAQQSLFPGEQLRPFVSACLGTGHVWIAEVAGRSTTGLLGAGLGVELALVGGAGLKAEAGYTMQMLPGFGTRRDHSFQTLHAWVGAFWRGEGKTASREQE